MNKDYVYLLKIVDPEYGKVIEYKTFNDPKRAMKYLIDKCDKDNIMYDHYIKRIGVSDNEI